MDATIRLPASFDVAAVRGVYDSLRQTLEEPGTVRIDGRNVEVVDTAGGQLLAAIALSGHQVQLLASPVLADFLAKTALATLVSVEV